MTAQLKSRSAEGLFHLPPWSYKYKGLCARLNQGVGKFWPAKTGAAADRPSPLPGRTRAEAPTTPSSNHRRIVMQEAAFTALVHGVYVVTTRVGDKVNGMTAAWVSQVSLKPLLVMVSIAPARYSHTLIQESGVFAINVLASDQAELAKRFGFKSGRKSRQIRRPRLAHRRPPAPRSCPRPMPIWI